MGDIIDRAFAAYFRYSEGDSIPQPSGGNCGVTEIEGKTYAVLRNVNGILAVYRVRNDGMLKRLKRWPAALVEY